MSGTEGKRSYDPAQRAAIDVDENVVVSAGAGSGKTTVLVERYARLVESRGIPVESILALTFTRKAAAEMNSRIHARLSSSDHPRAKEQLALFDSARISTLDSFCGAVARGAAHRYGIPPDFAVDEARLERVADEVSVELLMDRKEEPAMRRLVATHGFDRVRRELFSRVAAARISIARKPSFAEDARRQVRKLAGDLNARRAELEDACEALLGIEDDGGDSLAKAKDLVSSLLPLPETGSEAELAELSFRAATLAGGALRRPGVAKKPGLVLLKELIEPVKDAADAVRRLCENLRLEDDILAVGDLLDDLARRFLDRKRREGVLSFQDGAELAVDILKNDREMRSYFKRRLRAILIDEFQDNNELQKELLFLLAEREDIHSPEIPPAEALAPDKLYFVGDEKQSIYRFRGADVSVFRRLSGELERAAGKQAALELDYNHRSSADLVAFFNAFFPGVFGSAEREYEARFSAVRTLKECGDEDSAPAVEFHLHEPAGAEDDDADALPASAAEAEAAAARLEAGVAAGEFSYGEIAVLFRSTSHQHEYERAFRARGIPFRAADPRGLFAEGPANDLYAALRFALFPRDRNAYAAFLRSPFVALGDESLARVLLDERRDPFPEDAPTAWFSSASDARRFARGSEIHQALRRDADLSGAADLVARLWYDEGYRARLVELGRTQEGDDHFEKLRALALDADRRRIPLAAFLDELAPLMGSYEKVDGDDSSEGSTGAVRLLTVHKSKGLEFPVVVVADAGNDGRGIRNDLPFYADPEYGVAVNLRREDAARKERVGNWFFDRAKEDEKARGLAELRRLLYVAATRAEKKLLFFGCRRTNAAVREALGDLAGDERAAALLRMRRRTASGDSAEPRSFLDLAAEGLSHPAAEDFRFAARSIAAASPARRRSRGPGSGADRAEAGAAAAFYARARKEPRREASRMTSPTALEQARAKRAPAPIAVPRPAPDVASDETIASLGAETEFGTLCHLVIERALRSPDFAARTPAEDCAALFPAADEQTRKTIADCARELAEGFLNSALGARSRAAARLRTEFPFLLALDGAAGDRPVVVNGKMDLVFEETGSPSRCVIVDFKTDKNIDPSAHAAQMAAYRAAATAFSDGLPESWLFYLRGGLAVPILEEVDLGELTEMTR